MLILQNKNLFWY